MSAPLPWFRLYSRIVDDEKLRLLAFEDRWHFVALCALKCSGLLDEPESDLRQRKIAVRLGVQVRELEEIARRLREVELVDDDLQPASWDKLQFKGDSSNERVKRYREARKAKGLKAQWQPTKALRAAVYERDNNACVYCAATDDLTLDHRVPEARGGDHSFDNLQTACRRCNAQKRDLTDEEYRERLARNGDETLPKRPQSTDADKETEELAPNGACATEVALKPEHFVQKWNQDIAPYGKSAVRDFSPERRTLVKARIADHGVDGCREVFANIRASPFLMEAKGIQFDWVIKKRNFQKVLEGNYND